MLKAKIRKNKKKVGRKLFDGKDLKSIITKLEEIWALGASDKEAAFFAHITPMSLSRFLHSHPKISLRKQALLNSPILKARRALVGALDNPEYALKFLERKLPDEFGFKQKIEHKGQIMSLSQIIQIVNGNNGNDNNKQARIQTGERFGSEML